MTITRRRTPWPRRALAGARHRPPDRLARAPRPGHGTASGRPRRLPRRRARRRRPPRRMADHGGCRGRVADRRVTSRARRWCSSAGAVIPVLAAPRDGPAWPLAAAAPALRHGRTGRRLAGSGGSDPQSPPPRGPCRRRLPLDRAGKQRDRRQRPACPMRSTTCSDRSPLRARAIAAAIWATAGAGPAVHPEPALAGARMPAPRPVGDCPRGGDPRRRARGRRATHRDRPSGSRRGRARGAWHQPLGRPSDQAQSGNDPTPTA